ncbi:MAG: D-aminoacyl-tRNA deacylase [Christensenellales bacterium]|jgi:D-tyrosyl-tRNA(Tyr) deacylase
MRLVVQRVSQASVTVAGEVVGSIGRGFLVLVGVEAGDAPADAAYMAKKTAGLRVFEDEAGKMNLDLAQVGGAVLAVSQFTLLGDCRKGNRPSFIAAERPEAADALYEQYVDLLRRAGLQVETGRFQTHMEVALVNDGPVTLLLESKKQF